MRRHDAMCHLPYEKRNGVSKHIEHQHISICFSTTHKFMSGMIRWASGGRFMTPSSPSHALLVHDDVSLGRRMVLQAESWGFEHVPWDRWKTKNILIAEMDPIGPKLESSLKWVSGYLGTEYDYWAAVMVGLKKFIGRAAMGKFSDPTKLMCSEAVIRTLDHGGYQAIKGMDPESTSPLDLLKALLHTPTEFRTRFILPATKARYG